MYISNCPICRGFIDKYQLFWPVNSNLSLILISKKLTLLSSSFLKLQVRDTITFVHPFALIILERVAL